MTKCDGIQDLSLYDDDNPNHLHYSCPVCRSDKLSNNTNTSTTNINNHNNGGINGDSGIASSQEIGLPHTKRRKGGKRRKISEDNNENSINNNDTQETNHKGVVKKEGSPLEDAASDPAHSVPAEDVEMKETPIRTPRLRGVGKRRRTFSMRGRRRGGRPPSVNTTFDGGRAHKDPEKTLFPDEGADSAATDKFDFAENEILCKWKECVGMEIEPHDKFVDEVRSYKDSLLATKEEISKKSSGEFETKLEELQKEKQELDKLAEEDLGRQLRNFYEKAKEKLDLERKRVWDGLDTENEKISV